MYFVVQTEEEKKAKRIAYYQKNKAKCLARTKQWKKDHPEKIKQYYQNNKEKTKQQYQDNIEEERAKRLAYYHAHTKENKIRMKDYNQLPEVKEKKRVNNVSRRKEVLLHYGNGTIQCSECNTTEGRLELHHIDGDGKEDREKYGIGNNFFRAMIRNNFPSKLEILCRKCHLSKHKHRRNK